MEASDSDTFAADGKPTRVTARRTDFDNDYCLWVRAGPE